MKTPLTLVLFISLLVGTPVMAAQISIQMDEDSICPYTDPGLSYTTSLSNGGGYIYDFYWHFEKGKPSTASGNNPTTNWTQEGTFTITCYALKKDILYASPGRRFHRSLQNHHYRRYLLRGFTRVELIGRWKNL